MPQKFDVNCETHNLKSELFRWSARSELRHEMNTDPAL